MDWKITYYNQKVYDEIETLPTSFLGKYGAIANRMIEQGTANLGMPYTRAMGDGLFEIRLKGYDGIARIFYCVLHNRNIVMLHSFVKKSQQTPKKEMDLARLRMKEVKKHEL